MTDSEVKQNNPESAATLEESNNVEEMTSDEMAVDGYLVAGIASHEFKQG